MAEAFLSFGGNIGDARATLDRAVAAFCDGAAVRLTARSSDYRTAPWGVEQQPPFINLCIAVETELSPRALLDRALAVERAFGRARTAELRWGPRTLDIDILTYDDAAVNETGLVLPHPHLFKRPFVLVPLIEIRPDLTIGGTSLKRALESLDRQEVERLPTRDALAS